VLLRVGLRAAGGRGQLQRHNRRLVLLPAIHHRATAGPCSSSRSRSSDRCVVAAGAGDAAVIDASIRDLLLLLLLRRLDASWLRPAAAASSRLPSTLLLARLLLLLLFALAGACLPLLFGLSLAW
jgi:hypothetical protein